MKKAIFLSIIYLTLNHVAFGQNMNKVYAALEDQDWEIALTMLKPMIDKNADNYEAKFLAAICHTERYRLDKAIELFKEATPFAQDTPYFWVKFAKAYLLNQQVEDAERTIRRVRIQDLEEFLRSDYLLVSSNIQSAKKYLPEPKEIIIKNLGPHINTEGNEYSQVVTANQRGIYFTARREGAAQIADDGEAFEQVLTADMNDIDEWDKDNPLEGFASATANEAPIQLFNNDNSLITFYNEDLFISKRNKDGTWGKREALPVNSKRWDSHAFIYNNGNSMIFASDVNHEVENLDLYIMHKDANGKWGKAAPIRELNTSLNDDAPFVADDGTFYFSSRGHDSMGGYDIFSTRYDSLSGFFTPPVNMGAPINLPNDDTFFTLYGKVAYLSSSRPEGYGQVDIYRVIMFDASQIQGKLLECDGVTPVPNATISVVGQEEESMTAVTNEYGVYRMVMPIEKPFTLKVEKHGEVIYEKQHTIRVLFRDEFDVEQDFFVGCDENDETIYLKMINSFDLDPFKLPVEDPSVEGITPIYEEEITEEPVVEVVAEEPSSKAAVAFAALAPEEKLKLPTVFFDFDKFNIKPKFFDRLNEAAELLKEHRDLRILVAGHTDAYGTNPYNVDLGKLRYEEVFRYLVSKGVNPDQMDTKTFSEDLPVSSNRTVAGRAINRRVELSFVEK